MKAVNCQVLLILTEQRSLIVELCLMMMDSAQYCDGEENEDNVEKNNDKVKDVVSMTTKEKNDDFTSLPLTIKTI